jgi:hypothetical protein
MKYRYIGLAFLMLGAASLLSALLIWKAAPPLLPAKAYQAAMRGGDINLQELIHKDPRETTSRTVLSADYQWLCFYAKSTYEARVTYMSPRAFLCLGIVLFVSGVLIFQKPK